jgi:hypothetical protein
MNASPLKSDAEWQAVQDPSNSVRPRRACACVYTPEAAAATGAVGAGAAGAAAGGVGAPGCGAAGAAAADGVDG